MNVVVKNQTNSKSVAALTLGILSIVIPYVGLVLGIIGLVISSKAKKEIAITNEGGSGLAIAGLICSIVGIIVQLFIVFAFMAYFTLVGVS